MVNIKMIPTASFIKLGFKTKNEALQEFGCVNSFRGETEEEFFKRTYHIVINYMLKNVVHEEEYNRISIEFQQGNDFKLIDEPVIPKLMAEIALLKRPPKIEAIDNLPMTRNKIPTICSICNELIVNRDFIYNICHKFHTKCITLWLFNHTSCPNCRDDIIYI